MINTIADFFQNLFAPIVTVLGEVLLYFHQTIGAPWWLSIAMLTVVVRTLLFPLTVKQVQNMRSMQDLRPEMERIRGQYKDNRQKQQEEIMKLYQDRKVNPLGGCLPLVVQIPIFIVLYYTIRKFDALESFANGGLFWFKDLTIPDPYFILPVAYVLTMMASQHWTLQYTAPQQRQLMRFLPIVFGFFLMRFPAGLFVYWISSNTITFIQNYLIYGRGERPVRPESEPDEASGDSTPGDENKDAAPPRGEPAQSANGTNKPSSGRRNRRKKSKKKR